MKFIWYVTEISNRKHWGGTFVGYNQGRALETLGHKVVYADPVSDFSHLATTFRPDWVYVPVEFVRYPFFENIIYYKSKVRFRLIIGVGIFEDWVKKIDCGDLYITQWYGPGVESFPMDLKLIPHGFSPDLHKPVKQEMKYDIVFIGRNHPQRDPKKYINTLKNVEYFGYGWPVETRSVRMDEVAKVYNQALVCPNFHGDYQKGDFRMLNERTFQIVASGGFEVCDYVPGIENFFVDEELVIAKKPSEWVDKINYFVKNPGKRNQYIEKGMEAVQKYSYVNIMGKLINIINNP
jgi:glycosyltransferase involved in cell wall biosynthesis